MSRRARAGASSKPVARSAHVSLVQAAAKRDPRVAAALVGITTTRLDKQTLLEILERHQYLLSVLLKMHRDVAGDKPVDDLVASVQDPVETAEDLVHRELKRINAGDL